MPWRSHWSGENAAGAPWCPPADAAALRKWVVDRTGSLGTGIRRATRLARLMAVADGRPDYIRFLYERVGTLRGPLFRQNLQRAVAEGRLLPSVATLTENGVHLREAALTPQGAPQGVFEIDFVQMPRLAALLDVMHNALGFSVVADLLAPLLPKAGAPKTAADEVARALQAALNAWLSERLESNNHILQGQRIRGFIARRGRLAPETIDDEAILLFWINAAEANEAERIEGFRLYRTVATAMLRYRQALRDALAERYLEEALGRGLEPANENATSDQAELRAAPWRSPLRALTVPPANRVKWLTAREQHALRNYLGGPADEADHAAETPGPAESFDDETWKGGLAGDERFDLARWLTLLRADVFGTVQALIVGRLRKRAEAKTVVAQAMETLEAAAYASAARAYAELRAQLHVESLAALALLMEAGAAEAVILLHGLGGDDAVRAVLGPTPRPGARRDEDEDDQGEHSEEEADGLLGDIAPCLRAAIADANTVAEGIGCALLLEAQAARRKVSRVGFRREDRTDAKMAEALRSGGAAIFELIRELDRLVDTLAAKAPDADLRGDTVRFATAFQRIYIGDI